MNQSENENLALLNNRLSRLERKVDFMLKALKMEYREEIPPYLIKPADLLRKGQKQAAIEAYCETTGGGLAEAKAAIAELEALLAQ
jgi:hypothetical protein